MSETPWMAFYPGDYLGDTGDLTLEEHGAYLLLLSHSWCRGGTLPASHERLARVIGVDLPTFARIWHSLQRFWSVSEDGLEIYNRRVKEELDKAAGRNAKARANAYRRWERKGYEDAEKRRTDALAMPPHPIGTCPSNAKAYADSMPRQCSPQSQSHSEDPDPDRRLTPAVEESLSLVPDEPEAVPKAKRVRKTELPPGFFNDCLAEFCIGWSGLYGEKYVPQPKELGMLRDFLGRLPEEQRDQWGDRIGRYFADTTRYNVAERRHSLKAFLDGDCWNKYAVSVVTWKTTRQQESENAAAQFIASMDASDLEAPPARKKIGGAS